MPDAAELLERVRAKRLLLTVTTGRSGTLYLARVLGLFRGVTSEHEPKPTFSSAFRTVAAAPATAREFWLEHKLPRVARARGAVYAETSHLACKGFLESLVELGVVPELLHLVRAPRAVAASLLALGTVPGRTYKGVKYYLSPADAPLLPLACPERELTDYQVCFWYCLEIAERARVYAERFAPAGVRVHRVELGELSERDGPARLGERLGLGAPGLRGRLLAKLLDRSRNEKAAKKRALDLAPERLAREEEELVARLARPPATAT